MQAYRRDDGDRQGNRRYQDRFAESLIASLGVEEAVLECQANAWDGALAAVLSRAGVAGVTNL